MLEWIRRRRAARIEAEREADQLIEAHGAAAWAEASRICRDRTLPQDERDAAYRVRRTIEKRLNIPGRVDTATRYLED